MPDSVLMDDGATKVGVAWLFKEFLAFFLRRKKLDEEDFPSDSWKEYCREQFSSIKDDVRAVNQKIDILEDKVQDLRIDFKQGKRE